MGDVGQCCRGGGIRRREVMLPRWVGGELRRLAAGRVSGG